MRQLATLLKLEKRRKRITKVIQDSKDLKFKDKTLIVKLIMLSDEFKYTTEERDLLGYHFYSKGVLDGL